jgi:hypothetical protein
MSGSCKATCLRTDKGKATTRELPIDSPAPGQTFNLDKHLQEEQTINQSHGYTPIKESDKEDRDINIIGDLRDPKNHSQRDS